MAYTYYYYQAVGCLVVLVSSICLLIQIQTVSHTADLVFVDGMDIKYKYNPSKPNWMLQQIASKYSEFNRRFFLEISSYSNWIELLGKPHIATRNICIHLLDNGGGFGNRIYRDPVAYFLAYTHNCTLSLHWGKCQTYNNYFYNLFEDSFELIASNWSYLKSHGNIFSTSLDSNSQRHGHSRYARIHPQVLKILPFTDIIVEMHNNSNYDEATIYTDCPFEAAQKDQSRLWIDTDIDLKYGELRPWSGYMNLFPTLRMYGLLIQQFRPIFRIEMAQFLQRKYLNKFIIAIHVRTGFGEKGYNRGSPTIKDIFHQIEFILDAIFDCKDCKWIRANNERQTALFIATDNGDVFKMFKNESKLFQKHKYRNNGDKDEEMEIFTRTQVEWTKDGVPTSSFGKDLQTNNCVIDAKDAYIDSELLGFADILVLPFVSTFTKFSRALMMKRKKIICVAKRHKTTAIWDCKNFKNNKALHAITDIIA